MTAPGIGESVMGTGYMSRRPSPGSAVLSYVTCNSHVIFLSLIILILKTEIFFLITFPI